MDGGGLSRGEFEGFPEINKPGFPRQMAVNAEAVSISRDGFRL